MNVLWSASCSLLFMVIAPAHGFFGSVDDFETSGVILEVVEHDGRPALTVEDLKLGAAGSGGAALWVGIGTKAYFSDLTVTTQEE